MVQGRSGSGDVVPLMVRVPEDLRDRIKAAAEANGRSQNSEIVATLEDKYPAPVPVKAYYDVALMADYLNLIDEAKTEEERNHFITLANDRLLSDLSTAPFEIRLGTDPEGGHVLFVGRRSTKAKG